MTNLNKFLTTLERTLPKICADKDLVVSLPTVFKSSPTLVRMRQRGETPPYFFIKPNYHYLREDVINWLQSRYSDRKNMAPVHAKKGNDGNKKCVKRSKSRGNT